MQLLCGKPLPSAQIAALMSEKPYLFIVEEVCGDCGICEALAWDLQRLDNAIRVDGMDLGNRYITHGTVTELYAHYGLDAQSIANRIQEVLKVEN